MKLSAFCSPPKWSLAHKILHYYSLTILLLGSFVYGLCTYDAFAWIIQFPSKSPLDPAAEDGLKGPLMLMHLSTRILCMWMPFAIILLRFETPKILSIVYILGCGAAILLSVTATSMIKSYTDSGLIKKQYFNMVNLCLKSSNSFPAAVKIKLNHERCCGWYGPIDFGTVFDISDQADRDFDFMKDVAKCYGDIFTVSKPPGSDNLVFSVGPKKPTDILKGCSLSYKKHARGICFFIAYGGLAIDIFAVIFIVLYSLVLWKSRKNRERIIVPSSLSAQPGQNQGSRIVEYNDPVAKPTVPVDQI